MDTNFDVYLPTNVCTKGLVMRTTLRILCALWLICDAVVSRMASGGEGHRHARSQTMPIIRGKNALTNPKLLQMMETGTTHTHTLSEVTIRLLRWAYLYLLMFLDGNIQDGDTLSPTDIEANLSTEVSLTVLDVLELFVHHHKVWYLPPSLFIEKYSWLILSIWYTCLGSRVLSRVHFKSLKWHFAAPWWREECFSSWRFFAWNIRKKYTCPIKCDFCCDFIQKQLLLDDGQNTLMKKVLDTFLLFFQINQSTATLRHVFAALRLFVQKVQLIIFILNITPKWILHLCSYFYVFLLLRSFPMHSSRVRQTCVAVSATRSSSALTIDLAPPRWRQLPCCIFSWEKTLSLLRASP